MCRRDLSQKKSLIAGQRVEPNSTIVSHYHQVTVVIGEHELFYLLLNLNLVRQDESLRVIDVHTVSVISHYGKAAHWLDPALREISPANIRYEVFTTCL
jgi:hypothetical protein